MIRRLALKALLNMDGTPMPESILVNELALKIVPEPTKCDCEVAIKSLEAEGYLTGTVPSFSRERVWTLTDKGTIQANQI
jgi:hypothetical protein